MSNNLSFGTDNLRDGNLRDIYLKVKGKSYEDNEFRNTHMRCLDIDRSMFDFFKKREGTDRATRCVLTCAGLNRFYEMCSFPVSVDFIFETIARIKCIREIDWSFDYLIMVDPYSQITSGSVKKVVTLWLPDALWNIVYGISEGLKCSFPSFVLHLSRLGILEYGNFTSRSSGIPITIPVEFIEQAEYWQKSFKRNIQLAYDMLICQIKRISPEINELKGHDELNKNIQKIINAMSDNK